MCGRFVLFSSLDELVQRFALDQVDLEPPPNYNIAPTQAVAAVVQVDGTRALRQMRWGLIPFWAKDPAIGSRMINARAETVHEKSSFKRPFNQQRCLVVADGFYEWKKTDTGKIPMFVRLKSQQPFAFAGLYDHWTDSAGDTITSCTIITTEPNDLLRPIHNRMPVIMGRDEESLWLDPTQHAGPQLSALLKPYPPQEMAAFPVSRMVNSVQNNGPECIEAING
jgi:putative SOS response-associated peptidase YedK